MCKMVSDFIIFVSLSLVLKAGLGFAFHIKIKPNAVNGLVHNDVTIACRLDNSDEEVKEVVYIDVFKKEQAIAVFRHDSRLSIAKGLENQFKADGKVQKPTRDSYLNVLMSNPTMEDSGEYTCILYYLDETSVLKEKKKSANFTVTNQEVKSTLRYLVDELSELRLGLAREKNKSKESGLQKEIDMQLLNQRLQVLERKENTTVTFTAYHTNSVTLTRGDVLIYNNVVTNEGQGYNGNTGVFTAPVSGYYLFHLSLAVIGGKTVFVDLASSKGQELPRLLVYDGDGHHETGGSCVAKLENGEEIKPVLRYASSSTSLYHYDSGDRFSDFSGYLLKAL